MRTIDEVKGRCRIVDGDDGKTKHWIWTGAAHEAVPRIWAPNYTLDATGETMTTQIGRRAVWHIMHGKPIRPGKQIFGRCQLPMCVNPACLKKGTKAEYGQYVIQTGKERGKLNRMLAARKNCNSQRKVTPEIAAEIAASKDPVHVQATKHNLHRDTVGRVRMGKSTASAAAGMFSGLLR